MQAFLEVFAVVLFLLYGAMIFGAGIYAVVYLIQWYYKTDHSADKRKLGELTYKLSEADKRILQLEQELKSQRAALQAHSTDNEQEEQKPKKKTKEKKLVQVDEELTIVGVTFANDDKTERQTILRRLREGEPIQLVRTPMRKYPNAIAVMTHRGQIGNISEDDNEEIAQYMDNGGDITNARIHKLTGGTRERPTIGCVIRFTFWTVE